MGHILLTVTFYPLKMAKMVFLDTFRPKRLTKHNLGVERTFLMAKIFYIPLPQYVSKSLGTLTQKVGNFPNPPLTAHCEEEVKIVGVVSGREPVQPTSGGLFFGEDMRVQEVKTEIHLGEMPICLSAYLPICVDLE